MRSCAPCWTTRLAVRRLIARRKGGDHRGIRRAAGWAGARSPRTPSQSASSASLISVLRGLGLAGPFSLPAWRAEPRRPGVDQHHLGLRSAGAAPPAGAPRRAVGRRQHVGQRLGLGAQRRLVLAQQRVAERVGEQHPRHQHHQRQHVEQDDLARQRRAEAARSARAARAGCAARLEAAWRAHPVLAQDDLGFRRRRRLLTFASPTFCRGPPAVGPRRAPGQASL
jgi:hypothetical protein